MLRSRKFLPQFFLLDNLLIKSQCYFHTELKSLKAKQHSNSSKHETVFSDEIKKFAKEAPEWWDKRSLLHTFNLCRVPYVCDGLFAATRKTPTDIAKPLQGYQILDVGCGGGFFSEALARVGASVTGLDPGNEVIEAASQHASLDPEVSSNLTYVCDTIDNYKKNGREFDAIVCSEVVEHVDNLPYFISCCVDVVKTNGSLFFTTINRSVMSYALAIIAAEYMFGIIPKGTHQWSMFVKPEDLQQMLENCGCRVISVQGIIANPLTYKWSWWPSTSVSYALHAVKID